jgi:hypothetical protein
MAKETDAESISDNDLIVAPAFTVPGANHEMVKELAVTNLEFLGYMEDDIKLKLFGFAPPIGSLVGWTVKYLLPYDINEAICSPERAIYVIGRATGLVKKVHIEISIRGFICDIEVVANDQSGVGGGGPAATSTELSSDPDIMGEQIAAISEQELQERSGGYTPGG